MLKIFALKLVLFDFAGTTSEPAVLSEDCNGRFWKPINRPRVVYGPVTETNSGWIRRYEKNKYGWWCKTDHFGRHSCGALVYELVAGKEIIRDPHPF